MRRRGLKTNHMLIRALPLTSEVTDFLAEHDTIYFVEQNRDGQMAAIIKDENPDARSEDRQRVRCITVCQ